MPRSPAWSLSYATKTALYGSSLASQLTGKLLEAPPSVTVCDYAKWQKEFSLTEEDIEYVGRATSFIGTSNHADERRARAHKDWQRTNRKVVSCFLNNPLELRWIGYDAGFVCPTCNAALAKAKAKK